MISKTSKTILAMLAALAAAPAYAQSTTNPATNPATPPPVGAQNIDCTTGPATELDFWVGDWKVSRHSNGAEFGINHFAKAIAGCAIHEEFRATRPDGSDYLGTSLSFYDPIEGQWHQFYVDSGGRRSVYSGSMQNGEWVMVAPMFVPGRGPYLQRMIVRRNPDGSVRQLGAISIDQGGTWRPTYDLDYTRL